MHPGHHLPSLPQGDTVCALLMVRQDPQALLCQLLSSRLVRETEMVMVNDSNNRLCMKEVGALVRPSLHPSAKRKEDRFWVCDGEASDLCENSSGAEGCTPTTGGLPCKLIAKYNLEFEPDKGKGS